MSNQPIESIDRLLDENPYVCLLHKSEKKIEVNEEPSMKILIVEDDPITQNLTRELMDDWGFEYDVADNGAAAVELAQKNTGQYDMCLMDIELPVMNGLAAAKIMRQTVGYFPILATSVNYDYKRLCLQVGIDEFVKKPYYPDMLYEKINEYDIKLVKSTICKKGFTFKLEMPMDQQHAQELKKLKDQGLIKMKLADSGEHEVIAHRNTPNKISHDFNIKKYLMTEFINRDPERPTVCDLYRGNRNCVVETYLNEEEYNRRVTIEDKAMAEYQTKVHKEDEAN